ncbi:hypothetical protein ACQI4E_11300 [Streptomyces sp. CA-252508]|uniref:hypothetical protein n=1 Tax=Streptomyces sp. CA-252508 TaxID=3418946 RepID=UPI003D8A939E
MHHHGYAWLGSGLDQVRDGVRRADHPEFPSSPYPPLELAHWLLKPDGFVRGTWAEPKEAAAWFADQVRAHAPAFTQEHDRDVPEKRIIAAVDAAAGGEDVAGGWWLTGRRFLGVYLIACTPHRFRPDCPCPSPPSAWSAFLVEDHLRVLGGRAVQ